MKIALMAAVLSACMGVACAADEMKLAVTTSFHNSGLSDVLLPEIKKDLGLEVQLLVVGTGQALRLGAAGDVDAILVHSKQAELDFVTQGNAPHRTEIMYNDFVLVGPSDDPAAVANAKHIVEALTAIKTASHPFVSRGDESGTHKKERALWHAANEDPTTFPSDWYMAVGAGMGASLNAASGMSAYILSDRASWLKFGNKGDLALLFAGDEALFNQYAYLPINAQTHPHVNDKAAHALENWLISDRAKDLINGYRLNGEVLFIFNAKP